MQRDINLSPSRYIFLIEQGQIGSALLLPVSSPNVNKCCCFFPIYLALFYFAFQCFFIACGFPVENVPKM